MSFENALKIITELVNDFKASDQHYLNPSYSEAQVRNDFINKFFIALGWDVRHETQKNPYEQEVRVEKPVQIAKAQKRADYSFSLAPNYRTVKFFVEAKKPAHALENKDYYFQTARYGWNANTPIAVLTDFEELHIIDCRFRPDIKDALNYKIEKFHYSDYADEEKFRKIYHLFSREAVADGSIEKYADALPKPRGKKAKGLKAVTQTIDESFLEELDEIRNDLAKSFKKNNTHLSSEELTEATQRTIDRLVFIKFLEDKLIEPDYYVSGFGKRKKAWEDFITTSRTLDAKYNGVVFKKSSIDSRNLIEPDDKTFSEICDELSHENTPYNFDAIPIHILGSIYERFLGKVVNATDKRVTIEEKPEVRKAGGVYYTPQYIVNYIVDNTVGKLIEGKTPKEIAKMRFADIACGSGSFLITVFERLLDYHKRWYIENPEQAKKDGCILVEGTYRLSLKQKTKILLNNVYGVDIDQQAVEVTQLSLYLKLLEDETTATANDTWVLFKEQLLPDLNKNIVCGNSLIGTDILNPSFVLPFNKGEETGGVGGLDELKLKPMDFETVFPEVMKAGGFDAIVGNPPYIKIQVLNETQPQSLNYFRNKYKSAIKGNFDIYTMFTEKGFSLLNKFGLLGFIQPHKFFEAESGEGLRNLLAANKSIFQIIHFGAIQIFSGATTYTCLFFISKSKQTEFKFVQVFDNPEQTLNKIAEEIENDDYESFTCSSPVAGSSWIFINPSKEKVLKKIRSNIETLGDLCDKIFVGLQTSADSIYVLDLIKSDSKVSVCYSNSLDEEIEIENDFIKPFLMGKDVKRYETPSVSKVVIFPYQIIDGKAELMRDKYIKDHFPLGWDYIKKNKKELAGREKGKMNHENFYAYIYPKNLSDFEFVKIMTPYLSDKNNFTIDYTGKLYLTTKVYSLKFKDSINLKSEYFLGILNSKLFLFYIKIVSTVFRGGWIVYTTEYLKDFPIKLIDSNNPIELQSYDLLINNVSQVLESKKQLQGAKTEGDKNYLNRKCETLDKQIDELVYQLYGLTEEEIKIVEGSAK